MPGELVMAGGLNMAAKTVKKRSDILDAVLVVAHQLGMSGLSIANVARFAGVPKSVVLYHFSSRDALVDATLERWLATLQARIRAALEPRARDPRDRLGAWFSALFSPELAGWQLYLQLSLEAPDCPAAARAAAWEREVEHDLARLLAQGHKQLAWRAPRPAVMATALRCLVEGLALSCVRAGEPTAMVAAQAIARQTSLDLLLRS